MDETYTLYGLQLPQKSPFFEKIVEFWAKSEAETARIR